MKRQALRKKNEAINEQSQLYRNLNTISFKYSSERSCNYNTHLMKFLKRASGIFTEQVFQQESIDVKIILYNPIVNEHLNLTVEEVDYITKKMDLTLFDSHNKKIDSTIENYFENYYQYLLKDINSLKDSFVMIEYYKLTSRKTWDKLFQSNKKKYEEASSIFLDLTSLSCLLLCYLANSYYRLYLLHQDRKLLVSTFEKNILAFECFNLLSDINIILDNTDQAQNMIFLPIHILGRIFELSIEFHGTEFIFLNDSTNIDRIKYIENIIKNISSVDKSSFILLITKVCFCPL